MVLPALFAARFPRHRLRRAARGRCPSQRRRRPVLDGLPAACRRGPRPPLHLVGGRRPRRSRVLVRLGERRRLRSPSRPQPAGLHLQAAQRSTVAAARRRPAGAAARDALRAPCYGRSPLCRPRRRPALAEHGPRRRMVCAQPRRRGRRRGPRARASGRLRAPPPPRPIRVRAGGGGLSVQGRTLTTRDRDDLDVRLAHPGRGQRRRPRATRAAAAPSPRRLIRSRARGARCRCLASRCLPALTFAPRPHRNSDVRRWVGEDRVTPLREPGRELRGCTGVSSLATKGAPMNCPLLPGSIDPSGLESHTPPPAASRPTVPPAFVRSQDTTRYAQRRERSRVASCRAMHGRR